MYSLQATLESCDGGVLYIIIIVIIIIIIIMHAYIMPEPG